jgi:hypothetical protein
MAGVGKLWTIGISGIAVLVMAGCGSSSASQHIAAKAPAPALHLRGKLVSPPVDLTHHTSTVVIHPRLISPAVQLLPPSTGKLVVHIVR